MTRIGFSYEMSLKFEEFIHNHYFTLKCFPMELKRQHILSMEHFVTESDMFCESWDGFGNKTYIGHKLGNHKEFRVSVRGEACTDWEKYDTDTNLNMCYRMYSAMTKPSVKMQKYYDVHYAHLEDKLSRYELATYIMRDLYESMIYTPNITNVDTKACEAFELGKGVCQDYAHILITYLRMAKYPSRYIAGLMEGEGQSHAWVETYCNHRWYGLDPTNNMLINDRYIVFSKGRDAKDCIINQGKFYGCGKQTQKIRAKVEVLE